MRKSLLIILGLTVLAGLALAPSALGSVIGPWPVGGDQMWETQPIPGYTGGPVTNTTTPAPYGLLNTVVSASGKNASSWLPYLTSPTGTPSAWGGERLSTAGLILEPGEYMSSVHVRLLDPSPSSGKSGWAVILKDTSGNILDFGIRGFWAAAQIRPHQFDVDTSSWNFGATISRARTGNNYYEMDFSQNINGTINWTIMGWENGTPWANSLSGTTSVDYGNLSELYLSSSTSDTTGYGLAYKWTEFSYVAVPEPSTSLLLLGGLLGLGAIARRRQ